MKCYTMGYAKLRRAWKKGIEAGRDGILILDTDTDCHEICLPCLDGGKEGAQWGRLRFRPELPEGCILSVYALAAENGDIMEEFMAGDPAAHTDVQSFFKENGAGPFFNQRDILLYEVWGRYLWIYMRIQNGAGGTIQYIQVINPGDHFLRTFPEIYQERGGSFHRYLSVLSSVYYDMEEKIKETGKLFDLETSPGYMLRELAGWFGIDIGEGLLTEGELQSLLRNAGRYVKIKGTKKVIEELTELLVHETPLLIEHTKGQKMLEVTLLLHQKLAPSEELKLLFFLIQFKPVYVRLNVLSYQEPWGMDEYCFLDINARAYWCEEAVLDTDSGADLCALAQ